MTETAFTPGPAAERALRTALGRFATGIAVVTCEGPDGPLGLTVNSFAAVSLDPALVLWSPARASRRHDAFVAAAHYAIHVLGAHQHDLCRTFVRPEGWFDGLDHSRSPEGVAILHGCLARFECERTATHPGGDHTIVVGRVLRAAYCEGAPLIFSGGLYGRFAGI